MAALTFFAILEFLMMLFQLGVCQDRGVPPNSFPQHRSSFFHPSYLNSITEDQKACICNCDSSAHAKGDTGVGCRWKLVFKAVAGNRRSVYDDFLESGNINAHLAEAMDINTILPYRNGDILDNWSKLYIQRVKVEIYTKGVRNAWFYFDATSSCIKSWMSPDRLIASPYSDLKDGPLSTFSVDGEYYEMRRFQISRASGGECTSLCGYMMVVDPVDYHNCTFEDTQPEPIFLYNTQGTRCGSWSDPDEVRSGDRFVIAVKLCDIELTPDRAEPVAEAVKGVTGPVTKGSNGGSNGAPTTPPPRPPPPPPPPPTVYRARV